MRLSGLVFWLYDNIVYVRSHFPSNSLQFELFLKLWQIVHAIFKNKLNIRNVVVNQNVNE